MRRMRAALVALLAVLVFSAAGCGSEDVGAGPESPATMLKPGALVYWETASDPDGDQWQQVEELVRRFPDGEKWLAELRAEFEADSGVTWEEVRNALGDQVGVGVYAQSAGDARFVVLLRPEDPDKTIELVNRANEQSDEEVVARKVGEWLAISDEEASIDAALKEEGGRALADVERFSDGMAELPDDALSRVYVDVGAAVETLGAADAETARSLEALGLDRLEFAGVWAKARDDGVELAGKLRGEGAEELFAATEPYTSELLDLVPEDAFAFMSFSGEGAAEQVESLRGNPQFRSAVEEFEREVGVSLEELVRLFRGEVAFYAAPGAPIPELTLLLEADDPAAARQTAARMLRSLAEREGGTVTEDGGVTTASFDGVAVHLGTAADTVVLTTARGAIDKLGSGESLAGSEQYREALEAAGAPEAYTGLAYVDLAETIELLTGYASLSGQTVPPELLRNLEPLGALVAYGEQEGDEASALLFVEIQ